MKRRALHPAAMTEDVIQQIRTNIRERSLLVIGRDDEVLNEKVRQSRKPKEKNKRK
jgi:hypothetical protein